MLHKMRPDLTLYLAEESLKHKFADEDEKVQELPRDWKEYLSVENMRKIYARMMKIEVTRMMVESVYQSLSPEEREFVNLKYKYKKQMVAVSMQLNISLAQLNIWHRKILEKISSFMLYHLEEEDIFEREKVQDMIELLGRIEEFARECDPCGTLMDEGWLEAITEKREKYSKLLEEIEKVLNGDPNSLHTKIIRAKMANPYEKIENLAREINVDKSRISRHLKQFVESVKKYID